MARILVVDDEEDTTELLDLSLTSEGHKVIRTSSGIEAIKLAQTERPELIILDVMMPDINGIDVCQSIRAQPDSAHIPVLILSAMGNVDYKVKAFNAGADDYLAKPVQFAELKSRVQMLMARRAQPAPAAAKPGGKVVAVLGAGGGVGTSTVALNMAAALIDKHPETVIVEMVPGAGRLALQLGLQTTKSLAHLLNLDEAELTNDEIGQMVMLGTGGLNVLPAASDPRLGFTMETLPVTSVEKIIHGLAERYGVVVLDLGHGYSASVKAACALADTVIVVARAEEISLHTAIQQIQQIEGDGVPPERIYSILVAFNKPPYSLGPDKARQIFSQDEQRYNVLFGFPPMADLLHAAQGGHVPVVLLEPGGVKLKTYLQKAMEKILG